MYLTRGNIIFDILESHAFQKYSTYRVFLVLFICVFAYLCISVFAYVRLCETNVLSGGSHVLHTSLHYAQSPPSSPRTYTVDS